jgi:hypothetical protein
VESYANCSDECETPRDMPVAPHAMWLGLILKKHRSLPTLTAESAKILVRFKNIFFTPPKLRTKRASRVDTPVENHYGSPRPIIPQPPQREVSSTNKIIGSQSGQTAVCGLFAANF